MTAYHSPRELLERGLPQFVQTFSQQAVDKFLRFSELLLERNRMINLTAITDPCEVVTRHFLDCAALAPYIHSGAEVVDVGSGAGFPGIPLAILTGGRFTLLDAQKKRVVFLEEIITALHLENCMALHARAEEFAREHRAKFDMALSRAVAELRVLCELSLPLLKIGGVFLAMKAADCTEEVETAANAISVLGGAAAEKLCYTVPFTEIERSLVRVVKAAPTPEMYPRRFKRIQTAPL